MSVLLKDLPKEDLPRERIILKGVEGLSNEELLAVLLRTGTKDISAKDLAQKILSKYKGIKEIRNASIKELSQIKGMGIAKSANLIAAIELGKRVYSEKNLLEKTTLRNAVDVYASFGYIIENELQENFLVIYLDNQNQYIAHKVLFKGTINQSIVHPREVIKEALLLNSTSIILMHNHPSGVLTPSKNDDEITRTIAMSGSMFEIKVLDHLIVGGGDYYSYEENHRIRYE